MVVSSGESLHRQRARWPGLRGPAWDAAHHRRGEWPHGCDPRELRPPARRRRSPCTPPTGWPSSVSSRCPPSRTRSRRWSACTRCPTHGGMMDSHVFRKAAFRLPALAGLAVLRFNTRGTPQRRAAARARSAVGSGTTSPPRSSTPSSTTCRLCGWSAGRSAPTWRSCTGRPGSRGRDPALAAAAVHHRRAPRGLGRLGQAGDRAGARVRRLPAARRRRQRFAAIPHAEVIGDRGRQAPVGRGRRDGPGRDRPPGGAGVPYRCRASGTAPWRPGIPGPTPTAPPTPTPNPELSGFLPFSTG